MRALAITAVILTLGWSGAFAADKKEAKWKLALDQKGVKVHTRKIAGIDFKEFRGSTTVKTSLSSLVALVMDAAAASEWMKNCSKSELLKQTSPHAVYNYSLSKAPWPVKDRDSVIQQVVTQDKESLVVTIKQAAKPDFIAEKKGVIRVKRIQGLWQFTPQKDGTVEVVYQVLSDPGGGIPPWLVNSMIVSQPYETLLKLHKIVQKEKYQQADLAYIRSP